MGSRIQPAHNTQIGRQTNTLREINIKLSEIFENSEIIFSFAL